VVAKKKKPKTKWAGVLVAPIPPRPLPSGGLLSEPDPVALKAWHEQVFARIGALFDHYGLDGLEHRDALLLIVELAKEAGVPAFTVREKSGAPPTRSSTARVEARKRLLQFIAEKQRVNTHFKPTSILNRLSSKDRAHLPLELRTMPLNTLRREVSIANKEREQERQRQALAQALTSGGSMFGGLFGLGSVLRLRERNSGLLAALLADDESSDTKPAPKI
jgi:hypothetical protein